MEEKINNLSHKQNQVAIAAWVLILIRKKDNENEKKFTEHDQQHRRRHTQSSRLLALQ
jgi:hypothetical protein